ncbi:hypothetical protein METBIDRAFT_42936 [Metschnikowia bicuspidata var. bicuspidata NRRL YB-4993]|uniref:PCI domain-containing protein n=1 Tax=Metschnikowia bicuspidata var. bicuspidata NRRL YB-4993 TaxID=869754 RepID=A0A1A0H9U5_9ASCO|nr:hypothetical protein METBIDRAFT_42936 [Metschnikowia bicuspidata var. bicuspidata NRRL YB-4993]OBA20786.1 hypothetical protein METBIDRAFT_42936 [Metschnikowia bicuspidata var. bicuspidata NRRL YB-4993]
MSAMEVDHDLASVLANLREQVDNSDIATVLYQLEDFYERKLWNQLALLLEELYSVPESKQGDLRACLFTQFVAQFQNKLNPIKVVDFLLQSFDEPKTCLEKLCELEAALVVELTKKFSLRRVENVDTIIGNEEAIVYVRLQIARYSLLLSEFSRADEILDAMSDKFDTTLQNDYSSKTNAAFYLTKCQNYKIRENFNLFYTNGLLYLSSIDTPLSADEKLDFCHDLCIAALLGDKIYNFGELILHDILLLISAPESEYYWLYNLIQTLNSGQLQKFSEWLQTAFVKSPQLAHRQQFLHEKIVIMSLLELISLKLTSDKKILFAEICSVTGTPENDVEFLIIKCFSLGLIKGFINQIDQVLVVTWLQPRILNRDQVKTLYNHLVNWDATVEKLTLDVHANGGSVWAGV